MVHELVEFLIRCEIRQDKYHSEAYHWMYSAVDRTYLPQLKRYNLIQA